MPDGTAETVDAAIAGDQQAFRALVEQHWCRLVQLARSIVGPLEAEDVVQESLLAAWRALPQLSDGSKFGGWASRIVFHRCVKRRRWWRRRGVVLKERPCEPERPPAADPVAGPASAPDRWVLVQQALARLAPRQRAVLHLAVVEGLSDADIAETLGLAAGSVRAHRRRARNRLESFLSCDTGRDGKACDSDERRDVVAPDGRRTRSIRGAPGELALAEHEMTEAT